MGKAEAGTPKDISNRMKLKGLQKLKFFCQMCKKQCRDQNGFNCHLKSETHLNNMRMFAENPNDFIQEYSKGFEKDFLDLLRKRYTAKRVLANSVYKEFISDKQHVHMNSTRWNTLTAFIMHLSESGKIESDQTERGMYITYLDKGLEATRLQREEEQRIKLEQKTEQIRKAEMEKELQHAQKLEETFLKNTQERNKNLEDADSGQFSLTLPTKQEKDEGFTAFSFDSLTKNKPDLKNNLFNLQPKQKIKELQAVDELLQKIKNKKEDDMKEQHHDETKKVTNHQEKEEQEDAFEEELNDIPWLRVSIQVKIKDQELLGGKYYNQKAIVIKILPEDNYQAEIQLIKEQNVKIIMDQSNLETVIPKLKGEVMILEPGKYLGKIGILEEIQSEKYQALISLKEDPKKKLNIAYELFSKI